MALPERRIAAWKGTVAILGYHGIRRSTTPPHWLLVEEGEFDRQLLWLSQHFSVVSIDEAVRSLEAGHRDRLACITFDDGYSNNITLAVPVLQRHGLPATMYLATAYVGSGSVLWTVRLRSAIDGHPGKRVSLGLPGFDPVTIPLDGGKRNALGLRLKERLACAGVEERDQLLTALDTQLGRMTFSREAFGFANHEELRRGAASGLLTFGGHTVNHEILTRCAPDRVLPEVRESVIAVQGFGLPMSGTFAYPNGEVGDFDGRSMEAVQEAGCRAALTTIPGVNRAGSSLLALRRVLVPGHATLDSFRMTVAGLARP